MRMLCGGFPKLGVPFGGSPFFGFECFGVLIGVALFRETTMWNPDCAIMVRLYADGSLLPDGDSEARPALTVVDVDDGFQVSSCGIPSRSQ